MANAKENGIYVEIESRLSSIAKILLPKVIVSHVSIAAVFMFAFVIVGGEGMRAI